MIIKKKELFGDLLEWIKEQLSSDKIPSWDILHSPIGRYMVKDKGINPNELSVDVWYENFINSNQRNNLKQFGKYHVNQGGRFGYKKKR